MQLQAYRFNGPAQQCKPSSSYEADYKVQLQTFIARIHDLSKKVGESSLGGQNHVCSIVTELGFERAVGNGEAKDRVDAADDDGVGFESVTYCFNNHMCVIICLDTTSALALVRKSPCLLEQQRLKRK